VALAQTPRFFAMLHVRMPIPLRLVRIGKRFFRRLTGDRLASCTLDRPICFMAIQGKGSTERFFTSPRRRPRQGAT
jgi:hypothetical protein